MRIDLSGSWSFRSHKEDESFQGEIPGCNFLDLARNGLIPDPFYGTNEKDLYWVGEKDWIYSRHFDVAAGFLSARHITLVCESLDTIADVFVNGRLIKKARNCHVRHLINVKDVLKEGDNLIEILFYSSVAYVKEHQAAEKCPNNNNGLTGIPHIRKPQCHFGWDWGPVLTPSGISGGIHIEAENGAAISDVRIRQIHGDKSVTLHISGAIVDTDGQEKCVSVEVVSPDRYIMHAEFSGMSRFEGDIVIENPELWWTRELSAKEKQPLYRVAIGIKDGTETAYLWKGRIGLRTIVLDRSRDKYGYNFRFLLNGVPIFAKGANWIPADSFINRVTDEKLEYLIRSAAESCFNMLRVWGGGYYESDRFYDLCDDYGILVWQDFCFACQPYPFFDKEFLENVYEEIACNVMRLRHHASLCLWCGNNEIEAMSVAWKHRRKYVRWTKKFFYDLLPPFLKQYDDMTSFISGTPCGISHCKGVDHDNVGDTHLWAVWHGLQPMNYYRSRLTRFCSEFGFESLPDIKTIRTFAQPEDYSLTSRVFSSHQKCASGNMKMAYYIAARFRLPKRFTDYIYLSGVSQLECIMDATEHWRRNKGQCNGSLYWQYNDCWPVCSWAGTDYYGNYKALQYGARHFFAPVTLSLEHSRHDVGIYILNDTLEKVQGEISVRLVTFDGSTVFRTHYDAEAEAGASVRVGCITRAELAERTDLKNAVLCADLSTRGIVISRRTLLFYKEKDLKLPRTDVKVSVTVKGNTAHYTLSSNRYVRLVQLSSSENTLPFSDNYFDILPGETVQVTEKISGTSDCAELISQLTLFSAGDIVPGGARLSDLLVRAKVLLKPVNFIGWLVYKIMPTTMKVN